MFFFLSVNNESLNRNSNGVYEIKTKEERVDEALGNSSNTIARRVTRAETGFALS